MNTSISLKGGLVIKGFQLNRTGTYQYTLLAENEEGSDSKTVEVTVVGKDSILLNFISMQIINNYSSLHEQWCWILFLFYSLVIHFHSVKKKCKNIQTSCPCTLVCFAIVLNTGNLCPLRFVKKKNGLPKYRKFGFHPWSMSTHQNWLLTFNNAYRSVSLS